MQKIKPKELLDQNWLRQKYYKEKLSTYQIGNILGCSRNAVSYWMGKHGFKMRKNTCNRTKEARQKMREAQQKWVKENPDKIRQGKDSAHWKGGRTKSGEGYILIYKSEHPNHHQKNYVLEHRLIMEQEIGRYLYPWEVVHHINGVKDDNRIENLELLPNKGKHNNRVQKVYQENLSLKQIVADFLSIRT